MTCKTVEADSGVFSLASMSLFLGGYDQETDSQWR